MADHQRAARRITAAAAILLIVSACASLPEQADPPRSTTTLSTTTLSTTTLSTTAPPSTAVPSTAPPTIPPLPAADLYVPAEHEILRDRKQLGGRFAQAALTYESGTTAEEHAATLTALYGKEFDSEELAQLREAMHPGMDSVAHVRYVQMGGNRSTKASLMVWVDVELQSETGERTTESRVLDVRVQVQGVDLVLEQFASSGGPAVERPQDLGDLATAVLENPNIEMPDSARWDIYAGHTTDTMLERMLEVAEGYSYSVLVLNRGHPYFVFATDSVSRHTVGQAMDVFEVDGELVVKSRFEGSPSWLLSRELFEGGIPSIGSPWAFDGVGGRSFTDDVHQDHLHITGY